MRHRWFKRESVDAFLLALGDRSVASSRVRAWEALDAKADEGWIVKGLVASNNKLWPVLFLVRLCWYRPQIVLVQKVLIPRLLLRLVRRLAIDLRFEIDDAVYFGYPGASRREISSSRRRIAAMCQTADLVVTTSPTIAHDLFQIAHVTARVFPGPAPFQRALWSDSRRDIIWLGSPSTYSNVAPLIEPLGDYLNSQTDASSSFWVVGSEKSSDSFCLERVWSPEVEKDALGRSAIGLMPLVDDKWNRRKAAYKILVYLANAIVPVTPDVPAVRALLGENLSDLCIVVSDPDEPGSWVESVSQGMSMSVDASWIQCRDELFDRLSIERYAEVLLGNVSQGGKEEA